MPWDSARTQQKKKLKAHTNLDHNFLLHSIQALEASLADDTDPGYSFKPKDMNEESKKKKAPAVFRAWDRLSSFYDAPIVRWDPFCLAWLVRTLVFNQLISLCCPTPPPPPGKTDFC